VAFEVKIIPERKVINVSTGLNLVAGQNIKILVDEEVLEVDAKTWDLTIPENKKVSLRLDIRAVVTDVEPE